MYRIVKLAGRCNQLSQSFLLEKTLGSSESQMQFQSSLVNEVLRYFEERDGLNHKDGHDGRVTLAELSEFMKLPEPDARLVCDVIRRRHLISVSIKKDGTREYRLTAAGKSHLKQIKETKRDGRGKSSNNP